MQKNVASQKWVVFAFDETDNTPKTGDAANITANLRIDGAAANAVDDTNPTELEDGFYIFDITQAESNGDSIVMCPESATADIQVIGCPMAVWTVPAAFPDTAMRGTDSANTTTPPTVTEIQAEMEENGASILDTLRDDLADGGRLDLLVDAIKAVTDALPDAGALTTIGTDAARLTAARAAVLTDWIDGGRLDLLLDAITPVGPTKVEMDTGHAALPTAAELNAEVVDALGTDTYAEPAQGAPPATTSIVVKLGYIYKFLRNLSEQTANLLKIYNDAGAVVDHKATLSDDGTTFTKGEVVSGP